MALKIKRTGLSDYIDNSANIKMLVVGPPGVGKTRNISFWPRPILLDCEGGRGSVADRAMPYVEIRNSADMLDALEYLKKLERIPKAEREYQTIGVDTLDSFQRKVKDEWIQDQDAGVFKGFEAWGYLDSKMQALMTRLLNLDYHVLVNCHAKFAPGKDDDGPRELMVALQGDVKDWLYNDFDLVGWMGSYHVHNPTTGEQEERRGLKFKKEPDKPWLKDRFNVTQGRWLPINFASTDYTQFTDLFGEKIDALPESEDVGEIPSAGVTYTRDVIAPAAPPAGGPVAPRPTREKPLAELKKDELLDRAKELGVPVKGNWIKHEIVAAIEQHLAKPAEEQPAAAVDPAAPTSESTPPAETDASDATPTGDEQSEATVHQLPTVAPADTRTAEELVTQELGGKVIEEKPAEPQTPAQPADKPVLVLGGQPASTCEQCGASFHGQDLSRVQLAWFKTRKHLCNACYARAAAS